MDNSFFKKSMMGVLALAALTLSACAKSNSSDVRVAGRGIDPLVAAQQQQGTQNACSNAQMAWGKIFDPYASSQFESQVKSFVSATLDPQSLGTISGNIADKTGIDFQGSFQFDSQGKLIPASSTVLIKIFDSYVGQTYNGQSVQPYIVEFKAANSGFVDRNTRQFEAKFSDNYGDIVFSGRYDNQTVEGTVTYVNNTAIAGYQKASGTLGSFKAYTCALIK